MIFFPSLLGLVESAMHLGSAGLLLLGITRWLIPTLAASTGVEPVLLWFLYGGFGLFGPLALATFVLLRREGPFGGPGIGD